MPSSSLIVYTLPYSHVLDMKFCNEISIKSYVVLIIALFPGNEAILINDTPQLLIIEHKWRISCMYGDLIWNGIHTYSSALHISAKSMQ